MLSRFAHALVGSYDSDRSRMVPFRSNRCGGSHYRSRRTSNLGMFPACLEVSCLYIRRGCVDYHASLCPSSLSRNEHLSLLPSLLPNSPDYLSSAISLPKTRRNRNGTLLDSLTPPTLFERTKPCARSARKTTPSRK